MATYVRTILLSVCCALLLNTSSMMHATWPIDELFSPTIEHALNETKRSVIHSCRGGACIVVGTVLLLIGYQEVHEYLFKRRPLTKNQKIIIGCECGGGLALIALSSLVAHVSSHIAKST
ncbi:MAG: hypothetical protein UU47_C0007G0024 [candidate division TM6 bacterium GW2011_GWE2_41_16]|nr:MAG: hypothetical protein UU47_C0007G0024 [candidate division TM6 bacterium GW2011_GWE2_41_16]